MAKQVLPLFPLPLVLLPAMPLPLHIFEERYKEMMNDVIPTEREFGVVLVRDNGIVNVGCSALVERIVTRYPDGRLDLLAIGQRRFRISSLDQNKSYLRAEVEYFNDEEAAEVPADLRDEATACYRRLISMGGTDLADEPIPERSRMSFQLARYISDLDKRQTVLSLQSEIQRLEFLVKIIPDYIERQQRIALAKKVAPRNGHAKAN